MKRLATVSLIAFLVILIIAFGMMYSAQRECRSLQQEYPELGWRVVLFECYVVYEGHVLESGIFIENEKG